MFNACFVIHVKSSNSLRYSGVCVDVFVTFAIFMMTSSNWNIFRVTGPLCGVISGLRSPMNSPHKGQWRGALMFSLICAWIHAWVNSSGAGDLIRHRTHYDVIVMYCSWCCHWGTASGDVLYVLYLTNWGIVTLYDDIDTSQLWLR